MIPQSAIPVRIGEIVPVRMPFSEVCMHLGIAGKWRLVSLGLHDMAQILNDDGTPFSFPITFGEAGIYAAQHSASYVPASIAGMRFVERVCIEEEDFEIDRDQAGSLFVTHYCDDSVGLHNGVAEIPVCRIVRNIWLSDDVEPVAVADCTFIYRLACSRCSVSCLTECSDVIDVPSSLQEIADSIISGEIESEDALPLYSFVAPDSASMLILAPENEIGEE